MEAIRDPQRIITARAYRNLAEARVKRLPLRLSVYAIAAVLSIDFVPLHWGFACAVLLFAAEAFDWAAARKLIAETPLHPAESDSLPRTTLMTAANITAAAALAVAMVTIWLSAEGPQRDVARYVVAGGALVVAVADNQVLRLLMARQSLIVGTAVVATVYTVLFQDHLTGIDAAIPLVAVGLFALVAMVMSYHSAMAFREHLAHEAGLARARDAAENAVASKSAFLATISHELRTPLNGMLGMTQTLLQSDLTPDQRAKVEIIAESGKALNALLTDILDFSKLEAGKLSIQPAEDDLKRTIDETLRLYVPIAEGKGIALSAAVLPTVPSRMVFDAVRVRQCLSNLVSNALKFTEAGRIDVQAAAEPMGSERWLVRLTVRDTGIGIAPDRQAHLFQPYSQADTSIAKRFGGTGLGLSITRQLAESMGGGVTLASAPGKGSEFEVSFLAGRATEAGRAPVAPKPAENLTGCRVLVVDDVQTNRMVMRLFLEPLGVEVVEAADAESALRNLDAAPFDVAFLDLHLEGISGIDMAHLIRERPAPVGNMPLVAVTADSAGSDVPLGGDGFFSVIHKPVDYRQLQSTLIAALRSRG